MQTFIFCGLPLTITRTLCTLGAQLRRVLRWEWLTKFPDIAPLLQTSQYLPTKSPPPCLKLEQNYTITHARPMQAFFERWTRFFLARRSLLFFPRERKVAKESGVRLFAMELTTSRALQRRPTLPALRNGRGASRLLSPAAPFLAQLRLAPPATGSARLRCVSSQVRSAHELSRFGRTEY